MRCREREADAAGEASPSIERHTASVIFGCVEAVRRQQSRKLGTAGRAAGYFGLVVLAIGAGVAALLAAAAIGSTTAVFLGVGWLVFTVGAILAGRVLTCVPSGNRFVALTVAVLSVVGSVTLLVPGREASPSLPDGFRQIPIATGSTLAVAWLPANVPTASPPVVVLHGGPGVPDLDENRKVFAPLTASGLDVLLYAQVGTGASARLPDPRGYSRERDAADLEALRQSLDLPRLLLVGHSYGGTVAAQYAADHPDRVAGMVLLSPAPLDPNDHSPDRVTTRLTVAQRLRVYRAIMTPRALLGYALLQVAPRAARAYLPDPEADARNDIVVGRSTPALHCRNVMAPQTAANGTGFYAMQYPQSATAQRSTDLRARIMDLRTTTLIVKGSCDYLSWSSATDYRNRLPNSHLFYLPGAGHNAHQDKPHLIRAMITTLLDGRPTPIAEYEHDSRPADYEGPA